MNDHNTRPAECSTKYLESLEASRMIEPEFAIELRKRRSRPKCRTIRLARLAAYLEYKQEVAKHHQAYSGDARKMSGKSK